MSFIKPYTDPAQFRDDVYPVMLENEASNCLGIGIIDTLIRFPDQYPTYYIAAIRSKDQGEIIAATWMTPPFPLGVTEIPDALVGDFFEYAKKLPVKTSGIIGPTRTADAFCLLWMKDTGASIKSTMRQGIYEIRKLEVPLAAQGQVKIGDESERELMEEWSLCFAEDCGLGGTRSEMKDFVEGAIKRKSRFLWYVGGKPVAMAGTSGNTPNGIRINWVYTPPELRGRGHASALVARLSQDILDSGKKLCLLFTDLSNPTSNAIYQRIGYKKIGESVHHTFSY